MIGGKEKANSIGWLEAEIEGLAALPNRLVQLRANRAERTKQVHAQIVETVNEYTRLYEPVQSPLCNPRSRWTCLSRWTSRCGSTSRVFRSISSLASIARRAGQSQRLADQVRRSVELREVLDYIYGLAYLSP
ncbi:MAG TPA: hypothetical protein VF446_11080 [Trinickia sp.]